MGAQQGDQPGEQRIVIIVEDKTGPPAPSGREARPLEWWFLPGLLALGLLMSVFGK